MFINRRAKCKKQKGLTANFTSMNEKTKIAEIHYYSSDYSIICGSCPEICIDYSGFVQHYQLKHLVKEEERSPDLIVELNCKLDQCIEVDDQESNSTLYDDQQQVENVK